MDSFITANDIPLDIRFPKTAAALLAQAGIFLGHKISALQTSEITEAMRANEQFAPLVSWPPTANGLAFREGANEITNPFFVYTNTCRWTGAFEKDSGEEKRLVAKTFFHELGHLLLKPPDNIPEFRFYDEQIAVTFQSLLGILTDMPVSPGKFAPSLQTGDYQPYEKFSVLTPSPAVLFYHEHQGHVKEKYLTESGIVRFDLMVQDIQNLSRHFAQHLKTMEIFSYSLFPDANSGKTVDKRKTLTCWYQEISDAARSDSAFNNTNYYIENYYLGERLAGSFSLKNATDYFPKLAFCLEKSRHIKSDDFMLANMAETVNRIDQMPDTGCVPFESSVRKMCATPLPVDASLFKVALRALNYLSPRI